METNQESRTLGPRIKLLKRHVREWKDLLAQQNQVRQFTLEQADWKSPKQRDNKKAMLQCVIDQVMLLTHLHERQAKERQQMRDRHEQEEADLEQVLKML